MKHIFRLNEINDLQGGLLGWEMKLPFDTNVLRDAVEAGRTADQGTLYRALARRIREAKLMV